MSTIPVPAVLDKLALNHIIRYEEDYQFWRSQYGLALVFQKAQSNTLQKISEAEKKRQANFSAFEATPAELLDGATLHIKSLKSELKEQVRYLERINHTISSRNITEDTVEHYGHVRIYPLLEPKLVKQRDFEFVSQVPQLQLLLAKPYYNALQLQDYHRNYINATKIEGNTFNQSTETKILQALDEIKGDIKMVVAASILLEMQAEDEVHWTTLERERISGTIKRWLAENYSIYVPNEGGDDYNLGEVMKLEGNSIIIRIPCCANSA